MVTPGAVLGRASGLTRRSLRSWSYRRRAPSPAAGAPRVGVLGPGWLTELLQPSAVVVASGPVDRVVVGPGVTSEDVDRVLSERGWSGAPVVGYRSAAVDGPTEAVVQPVLSNPYRRRVPAGLPDDLVALAGDAIAGGAHRPVPGEPLATWLAVERDVAARRRRALASSVDAVLLDRPSDQDVTVVCVTNRPQLLGPAVANVTRQTVSPRLVLVTNADGFAAADLEAALATVPHAVHLHMPADATLGECLNRAFERVDTRYVAKMDDDDHYDPEYLADQLDVLRSTGAGVTGKHSYLAYLAASDRTVLRFPGHEHRATSFVAGGTLLVDRAQLGDIRFPHRNTGEDSGFRAACEAAGALIVSSGCLGYVQLRGEANTWQVADERFAQGALVLGAGSPDGCFDVTRRG